MKLLTPLFNQEILRVAQAENKTDEDSMKSFLDEIAALCDVKIRAVYHWRSGRHGLPSDYVPILCRRFGSNALLDEMSRLRDETSVDVPDSFDLALLASRSIREDLEGYEEFLKDFEGDGIQPGELAELHHRAARIHRNVHHLLEIAEADCARRLAADAPPRKSSVTSERRREEAPANGSLVKARK
jgi:hypothetical protein